MCSVIFMYAQMRQRIKILFLQRMMMENGRPLLMASLF
ncbi:hypothetical protein STBHUCCB_7790 [Salmonella enterica subsp. enterica serovar Typhi str. P-stx-12]|nr:hypothetical protein STBHUCCB_7790 [Salmonella enterica subsp. enterica serovar Typhi str. P-stx-12]AXR54650.1 hypothetical protein CJP42_1810 [Salmonella enterica subsp. enterica serovar Typhi]